MRLAHHHHSRPALLQFLCPVVSARAEVVISLVHHVICVSFTIIASADLIVVVTQHNTARRAGETSRMELQASIRLQVLSLDTAVTGSAKGAVQLVVVLLAIGEVVKDVKLRGRERTPAGPANEALLMVAPSETSRRVLD